MRLQPLLQTVLWAVLSAPAGGRGLRLAVTGTPVTPGSRAETGGRRAGLHAPGRARARHSLSVRGAAWTRPRRGSFVWPVRRRREGRGAPGAPGARPHALEASGGPQS